MTGLLWLGCVAMGTTLGVLVCRRLPRLPRLPRRPQDRAQRRGGTGHFLVLVGPDRCRCGAIWPCLDSVPADRLTRRV